MEIFSKENTKFTNKKVNYKSHFRTARASRSHGEIRSSASLRESRKFPGILVRYLSLSTMRFAASSDLRAWVHAGIGLHSMRLRGGKKEVQII